MAEKVGSGTAAHPVEVQPESAHVPEGGCGETVIECADATGAVDVQGDGARGRGGAPQVVRGGEELLLLLLLDLDELDWGREQRRGEATASTGEKDLAERGLGTAAGMLRVVIAVPHLGFDEEAVRREEHPVQERCGGLSIRNTCDDEGKDFGCREPPLGGFGGPKGFNSQLAGGQGARVPGGGRSTHQWRGNALVEATEALLACDGRERMEGGAISNVRRRVLEPVFHLGV